MSKVESLNLSLRHFLISTSEEAESSQNVLQNLQKNISDLADRSKTLHDQILRNETILKTLAKSVKDFKSTPYAHNLSEINHPEHLENTTPGIPIHKNSNGK